MQSSYQLQSLLFHSAQSSLDVCNSNRQHFSKFFITFFLKDQAIFERPLLNCNYLASKKTAISNIGTEAKQIRESLTDELNDTRMPVANVEIACKIKLNGYPIA